MKKLLTLFLVMLLGIGLLAGCSSGGDDPAPQPDPEPTGGETATPDSTPAADGLTFENITIGFVHVSDPSDMGYTYNHHRGTTEMMEALGISEAQVINKFNISEDSSCDTALRELVDAGCDIIFATSFGFEQYVLEVAAEYPEIEFCHATGFQAESSGLPNVHNYFGDIFEARYLSGIAAGLKTETNQLGYVAAMPFAECISGFTAFYLGALSVNPEVTMDVMYTNDWNSPTLEQQAAQALIDRDCDVIGQHCDSTAPQTTAEANGVWGVGYNSDMIDAAPQAALTSAIWDWGIYLKYAVECVVNGDTIVVDWSQGLADGAVLLSRLNEDIIAPGTAEAIAEAEARILGGWNVFTGPIYAADGSEILAEGEEFVEPQSAPSWDHIVQGITIVTQ